MMTVRSNDILGNTSFNWTILATNNSDFFHVNQYIVDPDLSLSGGGGGGGGGGALQNPGNPPGYGLDFVIHF